jgi:actin-related protein
MATDAEKLGRTVVLDYGSDTIKAGRARDVPSDNALSCVTPSVVEVRNLAAASDPAAASTTTTAAWPRAEAVRRGRVVDMDKFEALVQHVLYDRMRWRPGGEDCLIIVEPVLTGRAEREAIAQMAFEAFGVRGLFVCDAAAAALYSCNKQVGLSVDVGHGKAVVASVAEGATHVAGAARLEWAGEDLTGYTGRLLGADAAARLAPGQLRAVKEQAARCAASAEDYAALAAAASGAPGAPPPDAAAAARFAAAERASLSAAADKQQQQSIQQFADEWRAARGRFALPDGTALELGAAGYSIGEALMRPASAGLAAPTLAEVCCEVVSQQMDLPTRRAVWEAVLVCGGTGSMPGFKERLVTELPLYGPPSASYSLAPVPNYLPVDARRHAAWVGGAVLARVAMHQMITDNEYDEHGPAVVGRIV